MKNRILSFLLTSVLFLALAMNANAALTTESNINTKLSSLNSIAQYNCISLVNKSELIGYRLQNFNFATSQYQNTARLAAEKVNNIINQISIIRESSDFSDSDKEIQVNNMLQEADTALYDLDARTIDYLYSLRTNMPTITYRKYVKKFLEFYNSKNITNAQIDVN